MSEVTQSVDVVVSGGGLVGASIAIGLADRGFQVALIEPTQRSHGQQPSHDQRTLVLNAASLNILRNLGLLPDALVRIPITDIVINRQGGFGHLHLHANDHRAIIAEDTDPSQPYFGQVVVAQALGEVMLKRLAAHPNITEHCPASLVSFQDHGGYIHACLDDQTIIKARVLVGADGTHSMIREQLKCPTDTYDYGQSAMVFNVAVERPKKHTAFERFTSHGPLALLPQAHGRYGVVWIDEHGAIDEVMTWSDDALLTELKVRFGGPLGDFSNASPRTRYGLIKQHTPQPVQGRVVLVGNAANSVHPVSAQGFNLGLRDAAGLIDVLTADAHEDLMEQDRWDQALLRYQDQRLDDQRATLRYTDTLAKAFAHRASFVRFMAGVGLALHAASPTLTRRLVRAAMGFRAPISSLAERTPIQPSSSQQQAHHGQS